MAIHDAYLRRTPLESAFPDPAGLRELVAAVDREAAGRGVNARDPGAFVLLGTVGAHIRTIQAPDGRGEAVHEYGQLLFHAVELARAEAPAFLLSLKAARQVTAPDWPTEKWIPRAPGPAGYLQLPRHLVWTENPDGPPEPVDGLFWVVDDDGALDLLAVTGLRPDRPGFAVMATPRAPLAAAHRWLHADIREDGADFTTTIPGGDLDGLCSVRTAGELLKLTARVFHHVDRAPEAVVPRTPADPSPAEPRASTLPYHRIEPHG